MLKRGLDCLFSLENRDASYAPFSLLKLPAARRFFVKSSKVAEQHENSHSHCDEMHAAPNIKRTYGSGDTQRGCGCYKAGETTSRSLSGNHGKRGNKNYRAKTEAGVTD